MSTPPGDPVLYTGDLSAPALSSLRRLLTDWATAQSLPADTVQAIVLSGYEALANTVEHAYREDSTGHVELRASRTDDHVTVVVSDRGRWRPPSTEPNHRGRGLVLIRGLSEHTEVEHAEDGTTVTMRWRLDEV